MNSSPYLSKAEHSAEETHFATHNNYSNNYCMNKAVHKLRAVLYISLTSSIQLWKLHSDSSFTPV